MPQQRTPSTFSSLLVSDRRDSASKTWNPRPSKSPAVVVEIQSERGALLVSRLKTDVLEALKDSKQAVNGMIAYDLDKKKFMFFQEDDWVEIPEAVEQYVEGPESSEEGDVVAFDERAQKKHKASSSLKEDPIPAHFVKGPQTSEPGNLAVFNNATGSEVADSGLNVQKAFSRFQREGTLKAGDVLQLKNLGELQFVNGLGVILVDDLIPLTFYTRGTGVDAQVCTVFGGDLPSESSSPSALVEINSTTGALLISRMSTFERQKLKSPQNGMILYDTDLKQFLFYQKGAWTSLSSGGGSGDVKGPAASLKGEIPLFDNATGKEIGQSGVVIDSAQKMTGIKNIRINTPKPYDKNYSLWADSGIVAWDYFTTSSGKSKTILARDEEIHEEVESLWNALSFVQYTHQQDEQKRKRLGLIAEEVSEVMPHWVQDHEEGLALNKSALLDSACVMIQKLMRENKVLKKQTVSLTQKLDHFIKVFNQRAKKQGAPLIEFEEI